MIDTTSRRCSQRLGFWIFAGMSIMMAGCSSREPVITALPDKISLATQVVDIDTSAGFRTGIIQAGLQQPSTRAAKLAILREGYSISEARGALLPQISGTFYAGVKEGIIGGEPGSAAQLTLKKSLYDGGALSNEVVVSQIEYQIAYERYRSSLNEALQTQARAWIRLQQTRRQEASIAERLRVVRPLLEQVQTVAASGVVDRTIVAEAEQQLNQVRSAELGARTARRQAEAIVRQSFGNLPRSTRYDAEFLRRAASHAINEREILVSPKVIEAWLNYQRSKVELDIARAARGVSVSAEVRVDEPLDPSETSDSSAGLIVSRSIYDGGQINARIQQAATGVSQAHQGLQAAFQERATEAFSHKAELDGIRTEIALAEDSLNLAKEEVSQLRRQLAIGQSSLDGVMSAEVRLYRSQANLIDLQTDLDLAALDVLASLGKLPDVFGVPRDQVLKQVVYTRNTE